MITLAKVYRKSERLGLRLALHPDVVERVLPVNLGLTRPEQVEVGTVQHEDRFGHDGAKRLMGRCANRVRAPRRSKRAPLSAFPPFGQAKGGRASYHPGVSKLPYSPSRGFRRRSW